MSGGSMAVVSHGDRVGAGGAVLIVETPSSTPNFVRATQLQQVAAGGSPAGSTTTAAGP